jgi:recombinational DNA repair protein RecR
MGGELEFIDSGTLSRALVGRREIEMAPTEKA